MFVCVCVSARDSHNSREHKKRDFKFDSSCEVTMRCVVPKIIKIGSWYRSRPAEFLSSGRIG